jgi:hypothetical protein
VADPEAFYRVEPSPDHAGCATCSHGQMWDIVHDEDGEPTAESTSWGDKEFVEDLCEMMNDAYQKGRESKDG